MLFKQALIDKIREGQKTQTRRPVKSNERLLVGYQGRHFVDMALDGKDRRKWCVGKTYAIQPGRGKKAVGRILITKIREEDVRRICWNDALAEGFKSRIDFWLTWCEFYDPAVLRELDIAERGDWYDSEFRQLLNGRPDAKYQAWALTFVVCE